MLSGRAMAKVGDDDFLVEQGDALYVPKNTVHNFRIQGGLVFRIAVVFAPARDILGLSLVEAGRRLDAAGRPSRARMA